MKDKRFSLAPAFTDVAASKLTIRKRPIRDLGASHCYLARSGNSVAERSAVGIADRGAFGHIIRHLFSIRSLVHRFIRRFWSIPLELGEMDWQ